MAGENLRAVPVAVDPNLVDHSEDAFLPDQPTPEAPDTEPVLPDQPSQLHGVYSSVAGVDSERAAKVVGLSRQTNEPEVFVDKNLDHVEAAVNQPSEGFFKQLETQYPGTTKFLVDPRNMATAKDDIDNLSFTEHIVKGAKDIWNFEKSAVQAGALQEELGFLRFHQMANPGEPMPVDRFRLGGASAESMGITATDPTERARQIHEKLQELEKFKPTKESGMVKRGIYGATEFIPQIAGGFGYGAKYAVVAGGATAAATAWSGPGEVITVPTAAKVGMAVGEADYNYKLMAGLAYDGLLNVKDVNGQPLPDSIMQVAAVGMGAATAGLSLVKVGALVQSIPGGKEFLEKFATTAGKKVLEDPKLFGSALANFTKNWLTTIAHGAGAMAGITAVNLAGTEIAKSSASGQKFEHPTMGEAVSEIGGSFVEAIPTFGVLGFPGAGMTLAHDAARARKAESTKRFYTAMGDSAEASKLRKRLPESHQEFIKGLTKDSPVENIFIPVEQADKYLESKNLPAEQVMQELGVSESYLQAKANGGDIKIPLATWVDKIAATEHYKGLEQDIKFSEDDMTPRQAEEFKADVKEKLTLNQDKTPAEPQVDTATKVYQEVADQLRAAGIKGKEAELSPKLHEEFFRTLGDAMGVDPYELSKKFPLTIKRVESLIDSGIVGQSGEGGSSTFNQAPLKNEKFKEWFGKSQVVDEAGQPVVAYHGTYGPDFKEFKPLERGVASGAGEIAGFFTTNPKFAEQFAHKDTPGERIMPVYLKAEKIFDPSNPDHLEPLIEKVLSKFPEKSTKGNYITRATTEAGLRENQWTTFEEPRVIKEIKAQGFDSMYITENGEKNIAVFDPEQIKSATGNSGEFNPNSPNILNQEANGRITFTGGKSVIELFGSKNKSTFLHETGHYFLQTLGKISTDEKATDQIKADYAEVLKWLGVEKASDIGVPEHEKFARGFEAYLMEGKAPSTALQSAFAKFKLWLTKVYSSIKNLNVEMTPEIRGVMDRMLASKEEIARAQDMISYKPAEIEGLPDNVKMRIERLQMQARELAENALIKEQMVEMTKERSDFLTAERERLDANAREQIRQKPVYRAVDQLAFSFGGETKAENVVTKLLLGEAKPDQVSILEAVAEVQGYASAQDMALQIDANKKTGAFEREVKLAVDEGMSKFADLKDTDAIRAEALKVVHNEKFADLLALEHDAITGLLEKEIIGTEVKRRSRIEARIEVDVTREYAKELLSRQPIKDATKASKFITAERNAAIKVSKALAAKDYQAAAEAKRQQLLNHLMVSEALKNKAEAEKAVDFISKFANRGRDLNDMAYGFTRQLDSLLSRFGFSEAKPEDVNTLNSIAKSMMSEGEPPAEIANRTGLKQDPTGNWRSETLSDFVSRVNDNYYPLTVPDTVAGETAKSYRDLTMQELRDVKQAAKAISEIGKKFDRFLGEFKTLDIKKAAKDFRASVEKNVGAPYAEQAKIGSGSGSKLGERMQALLNISDAVIPDMVNVLTVTEYLDGGKDGPAHEHIYRPLKHAEDNKIVRYEKMRTTVNDLLSEHFTPKELSEYKERREFSEALGRHVTREEILSLALNWGNEGNRDRIRKGFDLEDAQIKAVLDTVTKKEWDFAQSVWNHLDSYWPEISALEMKINGVEPKRVERSVVETPHGKYDGGYYPIAYDFEKSSDAYRNAEQKNELYKQFSATAAHTDSGHTQARVSNVTRPVRLSLDVMFNHLENVIHDLEYRPAVIDVNRFLNQNDVKTSLENSIGLKGTKAIGDWLKSVASDQGETLTLADKAFKWFRFKATYANLGYRLFTLPMDITGNMINSLWEIGPARLASASKDFMMSPHETKEFVESKSERMRYRATNRDRDLMEISKKWRGKESVFNQYAFLVQSLADEAVAYPLWSESYKRNVAEFGEQKAKDMADEAVARTLGSGSKLDQVGAQKGSEAKKITSMYFSFMSMMFNRCWLDGKLAGLEVSRGNYGKALGIMAKATVFAWGLQGANETFWRELFRNPRNGQGSDEERKKRITARMLSQPFGYVWIARDIGGYVVDKAVGKAGTNYRISPLEGSIETLLKPIGEGGYYLGSHLFGDGTAELPPHFGEDVAKSASQSLGYPQSANNLMFNFYDWSQGNGELTWKDFLTRKTNK